MLVLGLIFFLIESENKFVRFHAVQSIAIFGTINIMLIIFGWIPVLNVFMGFLVGGFAFVLWIVLMYKSYQGVMYKLPFDGDLAEK